jgi:predicted Fe-Mo cluster-binding NifX family protein
MGKVKIAVPTKSYGGLEDSVSEVFGKAKTFTIVEVENGQIGSVHVIDNPAASYDYGSGPVAVKTLADLKIDYVLASELGPGASGLLEHHHLLFYNLLTYRIFSFLPLQELFRLKEVHPQEISQIFQCNVSLFQYCQ